MKDDLLIPEYNWQPHRDIDIDILKKKDGLFSFVLKIAAGRIVDYVIMENITVDKTTNEPRCN